MTTFRDEAEKILVELENRVARDVAMRVSNHSSGLSPKAAHADALESLIALHEREVERTWYVVDKDANDLIISGPYSTNLDAGTARTIIERYDKLNRTYWIEQRRRANSNEEIGE